MMTIGSLFSGIGGLELGLERATGGRVLWQVEREPFCRDVLARHWPDAARHEDVVEVGAHNLAPVDIVCGGFPCQDISLAGNGGGIHGDRSGLFFQLARIVGELRPRFVVLENVAAITTRGLGDVLGTLDTLGYDAWWDCVPAAAVGAPHRRDRWFCVAWLGDAVRDGRERIDDPGAAARAALLADGAGGAWPTERRMGRAADGLPAWVDGPAVTWPTPSAGIFNDAEPLDEWESRRARVLLDKKNGNGFGMPLTVAARMWPTPTTQEATSQHGYQSAKGRDFPTLTGAAGAAGAAPGRGGVAWPARPVAAWERDVSRTVDPASDPNRRARLRALGNAVVPQVAEVIGHVLMDIAAQLAATEAA